MTVSIRSGMPTLSLQHLPISETVVYHSAKQKIKVSFQSIVKQMQASGWNYKLIFITLPYHYLSTDAQFNQKYQALLNFLQRHENTLFPDILTALGQFSDGHILKDLFVVNEDGKSFFHLAAAEENLELLAFLQATGHEINLQEHLFIILD